MPFVGTISLSVGYALVCGNWETTPWPIEWRMEGEDDAREDMVVAVSIFLIPLRRTTHTPPLPPKRLLKVLVHDAVFHTRVLSCGLIHVISKKS